MARLSALLVNTDKEPCRSKMWGISMLLFPMKCLVRGMSGRGDDKSGKCRVMEMSVTEMSVEGTISRGNVHRVNC